MKKNLLTFGLLCMSMVLMTACHNFDSDELGAGGTTPTPTPTPAPTTTPATTFGTTYYSVPGATFSDTSFPTSTSTTTLSGVSMNSQALTGGMNFLSIVSPVPFSKFYIGVDGQQGYWVYTPSASEVTQTGDGNYVYNIPVNYGTGFNQDLDMVISGVEQNGGGVTKPFKGKVTYVSSLSGDLNINLTFSNAKDVDLHLITPSGLRIFYGARGGTAMVNGKAVTFGLDHDSNAGCQIDNLNNENIYIPAELIEKGTYEVVVDMYENCNTSIATSWSAVARYKGNVIPAETGANPASGVYPVGAGDGDMTVVMKFTINEGIPSIAAYLQQDSYVEKKLSDMDEMKKELAAFRLEQKQRELSR